MIEKPLPDGINMLGKLVIRNPAGNTKNCTTPNCFNFVFLKCSDGKPRCKYCMEVQAMGPADTIGEYPRPGMEYWDRYNDLPNYSFLKDDKGNVCKVMMRSGNWKDSYIAGCIVDEAQAEINRLRERLARLEPKGVS